MAQHDYSIANGTGSAVRSDLNDALAAIVSLNSGATEPASTFAFQLWADTTANVLKLRNSANNAWITLRQLDGDFTTVSVDNGTAAAPSVFFNASGTDTGFYSSGTDAVDVSTAGTRRLGVGSAGDVTVFGGNVTLNAQGDLRFADSDSSNWVAFQAPATVASNVTWTLPSADGTADQALVTNGSGTLSWADAGGASDAITEGNTSAEVVDTGSDGHFKVITEGTEALRVDSSQRVGVGTNSPAAKFHVKLNTDENIHFISYGSGDQRINARNDANNANVDLTLESSALLFRRSGGTESARLDSSGRLLVGTSSSSTSGQIHVRGPMTPIGGGINLEANLTASFIGTNDPLGRISFGATCTGSTPAASLDSARIEAAADGTWGSNSDVPSRLMFYTTADGASSPTQRVWIKSNGAVKITNTGNFVNSSSTSNEIKFGTNDIDALTFENTATSPYSININHGTSTNNSSNYFLLCRDQGTQRFGLRTNGGLHNYSGNNVNLSDEREKKNIINLDSTWDCLKHWELKKFHYNEDADTDDLRYGVIAQQVAPHCPEVITDWVKQQAADAVLDEDGNEVEPAKEEIVRMGVKEQQMMWMAIKALQEAQTRIETLETANASLEARLTALENA